MKKAEEYFEILNDIHIDANEIKAIIKQIQMDAIEEAVKRCAEQAKLELSSVNPNADRMQYLHVINKLSILNVAEQLKKEIE